MREGATVEQFLEALEAMRKVYPFKNEETRLAVMDFRTLSPNCLTVTTMDKETGVFITMSKDIPREV